MLEQWLKTCSAYALVVGNPAKQIGWVSEYGHRLEFMNGLAECPESKQQYSLKDNQVKKSVHEEIKFAVIGAGHIGKDMQKWF